MRVTAAKDHARVRRVLLDDEDVTKRCLMADDETGEVLLFIPNKLKRRVAIAKNLTVPIKVRKRGKVVIDMYEEETDRVVRPVEEL